MSVAKHILSSVVGSKAFTSFITLMERADGRRPDLLSVLTYHRVAEPDAQPAPYPRVTTTPAVFEQHMSYLAANCHVVSMQELLDAFGLQPENGLPPRSVLITFDDAYCDFAEQAWPILQRYGLPATLFVPTAFPDHRERVFWWDRLYQAVNSTDRQDQLDLPFGRLSLAAGSQRSQTFSRLRDYVKTLPHAEAMAWVEGICDQLGVPPTEHAVLGWDALRKLAVEGVTLAAHTRTHPLMNRISLEEAREEVVGSLGDLEREIGPVPAIFAYPSGEVNDEVVRVLEQAGVKLAFTTRRGINDLRRADWLRLRRINVGPRTTLAALRAQLLPWSIYLSQ